MKEIILPYARIHCETPIVYCTFNDNVELGFPEIRELIASAEKLSEYKPYVTLSDVRVNNINITNEGKRVLEDPRNMPLFRGTAALVKNNFHEMVVNFMNTFNKRPFPYRAFTSKEKAIEWLLTIPLD